MAAFVRSFFIVFLFFPWYGYSQGCSDGGVCSVGSLSILGFRYEQLPSDKTTLNKLDVEDAYVGVNNDGKPDTNFRVLVKLESVVGNAELKKDSTTPVYRIVNSYPRFQMVFGMHYGQGERGTTIMTLQAEGTLRLYRQKFFSQVKVPYSFVNGTLGSLNAMGDVTLSFSYYALDKRKKNLVLTLGGKIPTNGADLALNGQSLPMPYQTSLGSYDLLAGLKFGFKTWEFTAGYQHAFTGNDNRYLHQPLATNADAYNNFFESNQMKRADDAILRVSKSIRLKKHIFNVGALGIYHLQEDTYVDSSGIRVNATGSSGLTLNLNATAVVKVGRNSDITFIAAGPVVNRKTRTDGLTRHFVLQLGWRKNIY